MESNILIWNRDVGFIRINEGTGDNLLREDIAEGYVDYIMLDYIEYDGYDFTEIDGSQVMLREMYQEKFKTIKDLLDYLMFECGEIPDANYIILHAE